VFTPQEAREYKYLCEKSSQCRTNNQSYAPCCTNLKLIVIFNFDDVTL
jgi:hypothetical protein